MRAGAKLGNASGTVKVFGEGEAAGAAGTKGVPRVACEVAGRRMNWRQNAHGCDPATRMGSRSAAGRVEEGGAGVVPLVRTQGFRMSVHEQDV